MYHVLQFSHTVFNGPDIPKLILSQKNTYSVHVYIYKDNLRENFELILYIHVDCTWSKDKNLPILQCQNKLAGMVQRVLLIMLINIKKLLAIAAKGTCFC